MRYRQLDSNGDMTFGTQQANFLIDSPAAVAQAVMTSLLLSQGEWYLDTTDGTPYFENILGLHSQAMADMAIQSRILEIEGIISSTNVPDGFTPGQLAVLVTEIENFSSSVNTKTKAYSASCTLNTIYGPTPLEISDYENF